MDYVYKYNKLITGTPADEEEDFTPAASVLSVVSAHLVPLGKLLKWMATARRGMCLVIGCSHHPHKEFLCWAKWQSLSSCFPFVHGNFFPCLVVISYVTPTHPAPPAGQQFEESNWICNLRWRNRRASPRVKCFYMELEKKWSWLGIYEPIQCNNINNQFVIQGQPVEQMFHKLVCRVGKCGWQP